MEEYFTQRIHPGDQMLERALEKLLEREIKQDEVPCCIAIVISAEARGPQWVRKISEVAGWCIFLEVREAILFPERATSESAEEIARELSDLPVKGMLLGEDKGTAFGKGGPLDLVIPIGCGGKTEVIEAIRSVLEDVRFGLVDPSEIDVALIESKLRLKQRPDLMIRLGRKELSDFMIWQSAYSELYFIDQPWDKLKKLEFFKAIKEYQRRERRFGR